MLRLVHRGYRMAARLRGFRSRMVQTPHGDIHTLDGAGSGDLPPVVVLHGLSASGGEYLPLLQKLRPHCRRLLAPDLPGHGFSPLPEGGLDPEGARASMVEALSQLLDEPAWILGSSLGGYGAIHLANVMPDLVAGVILIAPGGAPMPAADWEHFKKQFRMETLADALSFVDRLFDKVPRGMRHLYAYGVRASMRQPAVQQLLERMSPELMLSADDLRSVRAPLLTLWGPADRILPDSGRVFFEENLPSKGRLLAPAGFGHTPFLDQLDTLTDYILEFVAEHEPAYALDVVSRRFGRAFARLQPALSFVRRRR